MNRFLTFVIAFSICSAMFASANAATYCWTVSRSSSDPLVNTGLPNGSTDNLYLWLASSDEGMAAAEMSLDSTPPGQVLAFNVLNGFLNAGNAVNLLLAVGGCPSGPLVAGSILILHFAPLSVCLGGANVTVDCSSDPQAWPHDWAGYADAGLPPCSSSRNGCGPTSVDDASWGRIKEIYR